MAVLIGTLTTHARTVREALDALLETQYCPTATADGMDLGTAIRGETIISGGGRFDVPASEWGPVLLEMAREELEACTRDTAEDVAEIRRWAAAGRILNAVDDEENRLLWDAHMRVKDRCRKLVNIACCLRFVEGLTDDTLDLLERIGLESPPESRVAFWVSISMMRKACRDGQVVRCFELAREYRKLYGANSEEEWKMFKEFVHFGLPEIKADSDYRLGYRYMLDYAESLSNANTARNFDEAAAEVLPGWVGSLQRKRLAERFRDVPARGSVYKIYNLETGEKVLAEPTQRDIDRMIWSRAAQELATDDAELTDLRKVYGNWTKEDARN